jgi:hypothetical protein
LELEQAVKGGCLLLPPDPEPEKTSSPEVTVEAFEALRDEVEKLRSKVEALTASKKAGK